MKPQVKLVDDWDLILKRAWSMRFIILSGLLGGMEFLLPYVQQIVPLPPRTFAVLSLVTICAAGVARVIAQPEAMSRNTAADGADTSST